MTGVEADRLAEQARRDPDARTLVAHATILLLIGRRHRRGAANGRLAWRSDTGLVGTTNASRTRSRGGPAAPAPSPTALGIIVVWAAPRAGLRFSDTWQLVINTGTTIVTFLMVFLIQRAQNKDALAIHLKLNELVAAMQGRQQPPDRRRSAVRGRAARSSQRYYGELAALARDGDRRRRSHSVEEARNRRHRSDKASSAADQKHP